MVEIAKLFEEEGFHKAADITLAHAMRKQAQGSGTANVPAGTSIGEFLRRAMPGDYMAILTRQLQPMMERTKLSELINMVFNAPIEQLYYKMKNINHNKVQDQKIGIFDGKGPSSSPSMRSVGQGEGETSEAFYKRDPKQSLQNFLPVLTSPMLILTALRGLISGYSQMTGLQQPANNPSPAQATYEGNRTMGQQFGIPSMSGTGAGTTPIPPANPRP